MYKILSKYKIKKYKYSGFRKCSSFILLQVVDQFSQHHLFVKEIVFSPLYILASFVKDKVSIGAGVYLWAFFFVPLTYISVFVIAALFIVARTWKQPKCPSADEWIRKLWYIYTMEYSSATEKNAFQSVLMRWMKLEPITQSEVSQKEKHQYSILTHIYGI